jgi:hypothetical protein
MTGGYPQAVRFGNKNFYPVTGTTCSEIYSYEEAKTYGETGRIVSMGSIQLSKKKKHHKTTILSDEK